MKVAVIGLGPVGLVSATALAQRGNTVVGTDTSPRRRASARVADASLAEPGLAEVLRGAMDPGSRPGSFRVCDHVAEALQGSDLSLVCVGTPSGEDGAFDAGRLISACEAVGGALASAARPHLVAIRSTLLPGTTRALLLPRLEDHSGRRAGDGFDVCVLPEFMRQGHGLDDFSHPARIVVGERVPGCAAALDPLLRSLGAPVYRESLELAEAAKYADNAFHALKVAFANEIARWSDAIGIDGVRLLDQLCADTRLNLSSAYLRPGFAFGGGCLPKDLRALVADTARHGLVLPVLASILPSNDARIEDVVERVLASGARRVAVVGLSFKASSRDLRESASLLLCARLVEKGVGVRVFDPLFPPDLLRAVDTETWHTLLPSLPDRLAASFDEAAHDVDLVVLTRPAAADAIPATVPVLSLA